MVSGQGVREGLAVSLTTEALPDPAAVRQSSVAALVSRFDGWVEEQAARRRSLVASLYEALEPAADPEVREALGEAATVLDIGRSIDFFDRHQHVADIVLATDLNGFSHRAIALLSAILRSAGDEDAQARSYVPLLDSDDAPVVRRAAVVLALADDIEERCPRGQAVTLDCRVRTDEVTITVPQLGAWRERKIGPRFERAFDRKLVVTAGGG